MRAIGWQKIPSALVELTLHGGDCIMKSTKLRVRPVVAALASLLAFPTAAYAATVANPLCPDNTALFDPDSGQDINVPAGFKVSVFANDLNFPTGIAFLGNAQRFEGNVLESGQ